MLQVFIINEDTTSATKCYTKSISTSTSVALIYPQKKSLGFWVY